LNIAAIVKNVFSKNYHATAWRIPPMTDHGPYLFKYFHSNSRANVSGYDNPEMDALLEAQRVETDPEKREKMLCDIAALLNKDAPMLYRGGRRFHVIANQRVSGIPEIRNGVIWISDARIKR
jgi:4-phytase/acid phosphatase/peptide/nickel transport system substrate-binding protein